MSHHFKAAFAGQKRSGDASNSQPGAFPAKEIGITPTEVMSVGAYAHEKGEDAADTWTWTRRRSGGQKEETYHNRREKRVEDARFW